MSARPGFTLLEVLVAIVVSGVVALLAWGTVAAGLDTRERVERHQATGEAGMVVRALLTDALRHPPERGGAARNDLLFELDDTGSPDGVPMDAIRFLSRGVVPPLGAGALHEVTLAPTPAGLVLEAVPVDGAGATLRTTVEGVHGLDVRVRARSSDEVWSERWEVTGRLPAAVSIAFLSAQGTHVLPRLVVHASLEPVR